MTAVFRSCLPRFYSNENLSNQIHTSDKDDDNEDSMECLSIISNEDMTTTTTPDLNPSSYKEKQSNKNNFFSSSKQISRTKKRGPRYSRINEKSQPLLTRLVSTIFGDYSLTTTSSHKKSQSKKSLLPSKSTIKNQFEENEQTLHSLLTLLTQIESNVKLTSSIETEQTKKNSQRKMVDNQQQTQLYPTKITIGTSTQYHEPSWLDLIREDQTTINAWTRIRRRLKPNQQKDILRALMIICANLFEIPLQK